MKIDFLSREKGDKGQPTFNSLNVSYRQAAAMSGWFLCSLVVEQFYFITERSSVKPQTSRCWNTTFIFLFQFNKLLKLAMEKRFTLLCMILMIGVGVYCQPNASITTLDFVKVKDGKWEEVLFFYQNNWKAYREMALKRNYIKSYKILVALPDSLQSFDIILCTEYPDSVSLTLAESRFQQIIKEINPNGPKLLNALKPKDFRENLFLKRAGTLCSSEN